jgi:hemerythrin-like domain-containing protein
MPPLSESSAAEGSRLIAWNHELTAAHQRLRQALRLVRAGEAPRADLILYCQGFCAALKGHHLSEDKALFPELSARHPELGPTIAKLVQDHQMIASLLAQLEQALMSAASPDELARHLDGLSAIMESHFSYEERQLGEILSALELAADPHTLLGPL